MFSKEVIVYNCSLVFQFASFYMIVVILSTFNSMFGPSSLWIQPIENSFWSMVENPRLGNCSWECEILFSIHGWLNLEMAGFFSWCEVCGYEGPTIFIEKKSAYRWAAWFKVMLFKDHLYLLEELKLLIVSFWCCLYTDHKIVLLL